jgi:hypothetical protein
MIVDSILILFFLVILSYFIKQLVRLRTLESDLGVNKSNVYFIVNTLIRLLLFCLLVVFFMLIMLGGIAFYQPYALFILTMPQIFLLPILIPIFVCELIYQTRRIKKLNTLKRQKLQDAEVSKEPLDLY